MKQAQQIQAGGVMEVPITQVKPNPQNPRLIKDHRFEKLVNSIQSFPDMANKRPLVCVTDTDGKYMVLGGNMRLKAMQQLKWKQVPILLADEWTAEQRAEFVIKDNVGFGEHDWEVLANEWDAVKLQEWGLEIPNWEAQGETTEDDYEQPDEVKTDIVAGDLFEIGGHRLLCGDSTDSDAVARLMNGQKADMAFTDPPYNIDYGNIKHSKFKQRGIENDNMSAEAFADFCASFVANIVLFNKGCVYMAGAPGPDGRIMFMEADKAMHCSTVIVWNKDQFTLGRGKYQNKYEPIWFGWVDNGTSFYGDRTQTNVWDIPRPKSSDEHPTMKPVELCAKAIEHASRKSDAVLDLFIGSGTTMVAAHQLNRKCYGMEIDPKYCHIIVERMLKLDPTLEVKRNGKTWQPTPETVETEHDAIR